MIYSNTEWKNEKFTLTQCGKVLKNTITILREKQHFFPSNQCLYSRVDFTEIFERDRVFKVLFHNMMQHCPHQKQKKIFRQINSLVKAVTFTKFLKKVRETKFLYVHTYVCTYYIISTLFLTKNSISSNQLL